MPVAKPPNAASGSSAFGAAPPLPVINQTGATVSTRYLERVQEVVAVNRNDLEDLLDYDTSALSFGGVGLSLISGAAFILLEQLFSQPEPALNTLMKFCVGLLLIGAFLLWQGKKMHDKKRNRIDRIFRETREYETASTPSKGIGSNAMSG